MTVKKISELNNKPVGVYFVEEIQRFAFVYSNGYEIKGRFESFTPEPEKALLGYWMDEAKLAYAEKFKEGYFPVQEDPEGTYKVFRGANWIERSDFHLTNTDFDLSLIAANESNMNGLNRPDNAPVQELLDKGYFEWENGEFRKEKEPEEPKPNKRIKIGAIRWDGHISNDQTGDGGDGTLIEERLSFSLPELGATNNAPWFSEFHDPEWLHSKGKIQGYATVRFKPTQATMDEEIRLARDAGLDYWLVNYYADDAKLGAARWRFINSKKKNGFKIAYMGLGLTPGSEDYREKMSKIWNEHLIQDWYMKIDGKPVVAFFMEWAGEDKNGVNYKKAKQIVDDLKRYHGEVYSIILNWYTGNKSNNAVRSGDFDAYSTYAVAGDRDVPYSNHVKASLNWLNDALKEGVKFAPNPTIAINDRARWWAGHNGQILSERPQPTESELREYLIEYFQFVFDKDISHLIDTVIIYAWNEHSEGGDVLNPALNRDGTIRDFVIRVFKEVMQHYGYI